MEICVKPQELVASNEKKQQDIFYHDVIKGLSKTQKSLSPKYFYDEAGCKIYNEITQLEEYYLTRTETKLLSNIGDELSGLLANVATIIEYGGGSGERTQILVKALEQLRHYIPIDVAAEQLNSTSESINIVRPDINVKPQIGSFEDLPQLSTEAPRQYLGFLPGSTIGNFEHVEAKLFLQGIREQLSKHAYLLVGYDLLKDPDVLVRAYDDKQGVTTRFNLNLLSRINRELEGGFDLKSFKHKAYFNETKSRIEMHLVSTKNQVVDIAKQSFSFVENESIHTENSHKYTLSSITNLFESSQWRVRKNWFDDKQYYGMILLQAA